MLKSDGESCQGEGWGELAHQKQQLFEGPGGERPEIPPMSPKEETPRFANKQLLKTTSPDFIRSRKNASFCAKWTFCCQETATYWISPAEGITRTRNKLRIYNAGKSTFFIYIYFFFYLKQQKTTLIVLATAPLQPCSLHSRIRQTFEADKSWGGGMKF